MAKLSEAKFDLIHGALKAKIEKLLVNSTSFEDASQKFVEMFYEEFKESIVLVRIFGTVPFKQLPAFNQNFVTKLATAKGVASELKNNTLVLSLFGTHGIRAEWNNRKNSQGHIGIPMVSSKFIEAIPMMSRLMKQIGIKLDWFDEKDINIVIKKVANLSGVFYVADAKNEVDQQGRKVISAQDFVTANNVRTVFGLGGMYINKMFTTMICFTKESIDKSVIESFLSVISFFMAATAEVILNDKLFLS